MEKMECKPVQKDEYIGVFFLVVQGLDQASNEGGMVFDPWVREPDLLSCNFTKR